MDNWDGPSNEFYPRCRLVIYDSKYTGEIRDRLESYNINSLEDAIGIASILRENINLMVKEYGSDAISELPMVGIASHSFNKDGLLGFGYTHLHNTFLEWDTDDIPKKMPEILTWPGMIIKTARGYHYIEESSILLSSFILMPGADNLESRMRNSYCCPGFIENTLKKRYAVLRVSPKNGTRLEIVKDAKGWLYDVYKCLIHTLDNTNELQVAAGR